MRACRSARTPHIIGASAFRCRALALPVSAEDIRRSAKGVSVRVLLRDRRYVRTALARPAPNRSDESGAGSRLVPQDDALGSPGPQQRWDTPRPAVSGSPASGEAAMISSWMNYVPSSLWNQRLDERSGADRRAR